jgi:hypothetical protein
MRHKELTRGSGKGVAPPENLTAVIRRAIAMATILIIILLFSFQFNQGIAHADDWIKSRDGGQAVWVDTSSWVTKNRWVDTSHWETFWGWSWISSGYWTWISAGHNDFYYAYMTCWPPYWGMPGYYITWWQEACYCCWDWGWSPMRLAYTWGHHTHRSDIYCPGAGWVDTWWRWHDQSYWAWIDTSYWSYGPYAGWVASGYWQSYQEWVASGYWAEPLKGTIIVAKSPAFVFTRWHYLTTNGRRQSDDDEPAHLDLKIVFSVNKPIKSYRIYADIQRTDAGRAHYQVALVSGTYVVPQPIGSITAEGEYDYAGLGTHFIQITATDGATATAYFDIPINGYRSINIDESSQSAPGQPFIRSLQDNGSVTF